MPARSVTLQDVASAAGVHVATASRALNPATRSLVNDETASRIQSLAESLGYRTNPLARGLRTNKSMSIGVLVPDLQNPFYPPIVRGIDDELSAHHYFPLVANTDGSLAKEKVVWERLLARQVDGFITATALMTHPLIRKAAKDGTKLVLVSRTVANLSVPAVVFDEAGALDLAVAHLVELGHREIGHVAGPAEVSIGVNREAAFVAACRRHGLASDHIEAGGELTEAEGEQACGRLLARSPGVTAVIAANDLMALGCLGAIAAAGRRCPDDISLVGINDMSFLDRVNPPLTSVATPKYEMGRSAAQLLLSLLDSDGPMPVEVRQLQARLVTRASTGPAPQPGTPKRRRR